MRPQRIRKLIVAIIGSVLAMEFPDLVGMEETLAGPILMLLTWIGVYAVPNEPEVKS